MLKDAITASQLFHWMEKTQELWVGGLFIFLIAVFFRVVTGSHSYSGQGKPPMYGDYEAQVSSRKAIGFS
jgi:hypothetical protein